MMIGSKMTASADEIDDHRCTPSERVKSRRYLLEMAVATVVYATTLFVSAATVEGLPHGPLKIAVALLPMIGSLLMAAALIRFILRIDEMQRQMLVQSAAIAAAGTAIVTLALGFLENAGVPRISMTWVWPITAAFLGVSVPFVRRRYR